jgi:hypothetical protein
LASGTDPSNRVERGDISARGDVRDTYIGNSDNPRLPAHQGEGPKASDGTNHSQADQQIYSKAPKPEASSSQPNQSYKQPEAVQSKKPEGGTIKTEPNESREPKEPKESKKPAEIPNRSDGGNGVVIRHPLGSGRHDGRGATGQGGHGLDKEPNTKDWATKAAKDMKAEPGTTVKAMTDGKIVNITEDKRTDKTGKVFGDQITIVSNNGAVKTFYTHINVSQEIKDRLNANPKGIDIHRGDTIGTVAKWGDNPSESHLHLGMAARGTDGSYHGVDPSAALNASQNADRDLTVTPDGGYFVGDNKYTVPLDASESSGASTSRETDYEDTPGARRR